MRQQPRRLRLTIARLSIVVAAIAVGLAAERWISGRHPAATRRRERAARHTLEAEMWQTLDENSRKHPNLADPRPHYERAALHPTGSLANPRRFDPSGRPWEYRYEVGYRWLGPADLDRSEALVREDFFTLCRETSEYHARMAEKWSRGARLPWLDVEPDPPAPPLIYEPQGTSW